MGFWLTEFEILEGISYNQLWDTRIRQWIESLKGTVSSKSMRMRRSAENSRVRRSENQWKSPGVFHMYR